MHELSIAMGIVDAAADEAQRRRVKVNAVHLRLGVLSGVVKDALLFSYELACQDTPLAGSRLVVEEVPLRAHCPACGAERSVVSPQELCCAECGTPAPERDADTPLLSTFYGWRLERHTSTWRCPPCWRRYQQKRRTSRPPRT